jgi:hypothetical protein
MISKCANPSCDELFLYFRGGKLFLRDVGPHTQSEEASTTDRPRRREHFWLCRHCAATMTIVIGQSGTPAVITTPFGEVQSSEDRLLRQPQEAGPVQTILR